MKTCTATTILVCIFSLLSCERGFLSSIFGPDVHYSLPDEYKTAFDNKDTLFYHSPNANEIFIIDSVINGEFYESITGTCGKRPFDIFEYQIIYIRKPKDSILYYAEKSYDDCFGPPENYSKGICIVKGLIDTYADDGIDTDSRINWYNQIETKVSDYSKYYPEKKIGSSIFEMVYEFDCKEENQSNIKKWYYTDKYGFVGYIKTHGEIFVLDRFFRND